MVFSVSVSARAVGSSWRQNFKSLPERAPCPLVHRVPADLLAFMVRGHPAIFAGSGPDVINWLWKIAYWVGAWTIASYRPDILPRSALVHWRICVPL